MLAVESIWRRMVMMDITLMMPICVTEDGGDEDNNWKKYVCD